MTVARAFRIVAVLEACSWAGLLVGMAFKYTDNGEAGVHLFGPVHGALFVAYVLLAVPAARSVGWGWRGTALTVAAAVPPFTSLLAERAMARSDAAREQRIAH